MAEIDDLALGINRNRSFKEESSLSYDNFGIGKANDLVDSEGEFERLCDDREKIFNNKDNGKVLEKESENENENNINPSMAIDSHQNIIVNEDKEDKLKETEKTSPNSSGNSLLTTEQITMLSSIVQKSLTTMLAKNNEQNQIHISPRLIQSVLAESIDKLNLKINSHDLQTISSSFYTNFNCTTENPLNTENGNIGKKNDNINGINLTPTAEQKSATENKPIPKKRSKYNSISNETRKYIINEVFNNKVSQAKLARDLNISASTIKSIVQTYRNESRVQKKPRGGHTYSKIPQEVFDCIKEMLNENGLSKAAILAKVKTLYPLQDITQAMIMYVARNKNNQAKDSDGNSQNTSNDINDLGLNNKPKFDESGLTEIKHNECNSTNCLVLSPVEQTLTNNITVDNCNMSLNSPIQNNYDQQIYNSSYNNNNKRIINGFTNENSQNNISGISMQNTLMLNNGYINRPVQQNQTKVMINNNCISTNKNAVVSPVYITTQTTNQEILRNYTQSPLNSTGSQIENVFTGNAMFGSPVPENSHAINNTQLFNPGIATQTQSLNMNLLNNGTFSDGIEFSGNSNNNNNSVFNSYNNCNASNNYFNQQNQKFPMINISRESTLINEQSGNENSTNTNSKLIHNSRGCIPVAQIQYATNGLNQIQNHRNPSFNNIPGASTSYYYKPSFSENSASNAICQENSQNSTSGKRYTTHLSHAPIGIGIGNSSMDSNYSDFLPPYVPVPIQQTNNPNSRYVLNSGAGYSNNHSTGNSFLSIENEKMPIYGNNGMYQVNTQSDLLKPQWKPNEQNSQNQNSIKANQLFGIPNEKPRINLYKKKQTVEAANSYVNNEYSVNNMASNMEMSNQSVHSVTNNFSSIFANGSNQIFMNMEDSASRQSYCQPKQIDIQMLNNINDYSVESSNRM